MYRCFLLSTLLLIPFWLYPQTTFQNLGVMQSEDTVRISYDLWSGSELESYLIDIDVSSDGGNSFNIIPKLTSGALGYGVKHGNNKQINWVPLKEGIELVGDKFIFRLKLSVPGSSHEVEFIKVVGGTFAIGDSFEQGDFDERRLNKVNLDDYEISKFEITNTQFSLFLKTYGSNNVKSGEFEGEKLIYENERGLKYVSGVWRPVSGYENFPVVGVTWYGANEFCKFNRYRLPTEAEWEYAAREQGQKIIFGNGSNVANTRQINYTEISLLDSSEIKELKNNPNYQQSVGAYPPNILGLFQMSGNVWEWCQDWYSFNYDTTKHLNPTGPWLGNYKVIRGGAYNSSAKAVRVFERSFLAAHKYANDVGFRVARSINDIKD